MKNISKIFLIVLCMTLFLVGCNTNNTQKESEEREYADDSFIQDMAKGLEERWRLIEIDEGKEGYGDIYLDSEEYQQMMLKYIDAELNKIEKYTEEKFENKSLQEIAIKYINLLKNHKDICQYMVVDYDKYSEEFNIIYDERSKIVETMIKEYGMTLDEKYKSYVDEFLTNSQLVLEQEKNEKAINNMLKNLQFKDVTDDDSDWHTYQTVVENTTGINFETLSICINLIDKDEVIVDTIYDQVSSLKNGAKVRFEFTTDKKFKTTEVSLDWWE